MVFIVIGAILWPLCVANSSPYEFNHSQTQFGEENIALDSNDWAQLYKQRDQYELWNGIKSYCYTTNEPSSFYPSICSQLDNIPYAKSRNLNKQKFACSHAQDSHQRVGQNFDFDHWSSFLGLGDLDGQLKAYEYMQSLPPVQFSGSIPYQSYETWTYETCDKVLDGYQCGHQSFCINKSVQQVVDGHIKSKRLKICRELPLHCYVDTVHHESRPCSVEHLTYDTAFSRPTMEEWSPESEGYVDLLANPYHLLPGEKELIQVANQAGGLREQLNPRLSFVDPYNEYEVQASGTALGAACKENSDYHASFSILTKQRLISQSPNAFKTPVSWDNEPIDPIVWEPKTNHKGELVEEAIPSKLRLQDTAAGIISFVAQLSHLNEPEASKAISQPFNKNTKLRIRLVKKRWWWWDQVINERILSEYEGTQSSFYPVAEDQGIKLSDYWEIDLNHPNASLNLFLKERSFPFNLLFGSTSFRNQLKPKQRYAIKVSMYQSGVPFYRQSCKDKPNTWYCQWYSKWIFGPRISWYYSKELEIPFKTKDNYDPRSFSRYMLDYSIFGVESLLDWIGEVFVWKK